MERVERKESEKTTLDNKRWGHTKKKEVEQSRTIAGPVNEVLLVEAT